MILTLGFKIFVFSNLNIKHHIVKNIFCTISLKINGFVEDYNETKSLKLIPPDEKYEKVLDTFKFLIK